jgi:hypothetical protein
MVKACTLAWEALCETGLCKMQDKAKKRIQALLNPAVLVCQKQLLLPLDLCCGRHEIV